MPKTLDYEIAQNALPTLLATAAYSPLTRRGLLQVHGEDRLRWLNGMVTNSIQALETGEGCYNFFLNAQGRIQGDATAYRLEDFILLESDRARIPSLMEMLDRFIIMDDVELILDDRAGIAIVGPHAAAILEGLELPPSIGPLQLAASTFQGAPVDLIHAYSPLVPRFELWGTPETIAHLLEALHAAGVALASDDTLEALRLLEGTPLYGQDIRDKELPQETAQTRALHFAKGCYLGQEIVERIRSRGNVHRTFAGFVLSGDLPDGPAPTTGSALFAANAPEKPVGELTSVGQVELPSGTITLALGYVRREALDANLPLRYNGGSATPTPLPYPAV